MRSTAEGIVYGAFDIVEKKLIEESREGLVRHSSNRVARAIYYWFRKRQKEKGKGNVNA